MKVDTLSTIVAALESGRRPRGGVSNGSGTIPSLGGEHLNNDGGFRFDNLKFVDEEFFNGLNKGAIKKNDILIVKDGATTGKVSFVGPDFPYQKAAINEHLFAVTVDPSQADPRYVFIFLKSPHGQKEILKDFRGAAIGGISRRFVDLTRIPLPPLHDQIRIAHLLSKMGGLVAQRKQHLQELDDLLKSVFLEMFGDPVRNEKGWDKRSLQTFGKISTGNTPPRNDASNYGGRHIEWIKTDNIGADSVFVTTAAEYLSESGGKRARTVSKGALLVACIAGSVGSIGRAALTDRTVAFNQQINTIQPTNDVSPLFLYGLFKLSRSYIQSHASKGMKKILTKGDFEQIKMIKPPFESQQKFAEVAEKIESVKVDYQQSLTDLETLYGALSQQAFKGELDLSRVPLPDAKPQEPQTAVTAADPPSAIHLPDTELLLAALDERAGLKELLPFWLEAYRDQLNGVVFSVQDFLSASQARIAELHPDNDFELGIDAYELVKAWVFDRISSRELKQTRSMVSIGGKRKFGNEVLLRVRGPSFS